MKEAQELVRLAKELISVSSGVDAYDHLKDPMTIAYEKALQNIDNWFLPASGYYRSVTVGVFPWALRLSPREFDAVQVNVTIYPPGGPAGNKILLSAGGYGMADYQLENRGFKQLRFGIPVSRFVREVVDFIESLKVK